MTPGPFQSVSYVCEVDANGWKTHHLICSRTGATASGRYLETVVATLGVRIRHFNDQRAAEDRQTALAVAQIQAGGTP